MKTIKEFKIFVVDDDPFYLSIVEEILTKLGIKEVVKFDNGYSCLERLNENPDVIFLDYSMDDIDGYEVLKKIKRYDPNIYIVMLSAQENIDVVVDVLKNGSFDYVKKGKGIEQKIDKVLKKIEKVNLLLTKSKPNLIQKIFKYL